MISKSIIYKLRKITQTKEKKDFEEVHATVINTGATEDALQQLGKQDVKYIFKTSTKMYIDFWPEFF